MTTTAGAPDRSARAVPSRVLAVPHLPGSRQLSVLDNGLQLCLLENRQAPLVTTALWYRVGARHERSGERGLAHFLEHMMFKGSGRYGPGEIDRRTLALGGHNNAFTSHDATVYYFQFAADCWQEALRIEADRMADLTLAGEEIDNERQVILEEIAMYENEPWEALEQRVFAELYPSHPYGMSVLGLRADLLQSGAGELRGFHHRHYAPDNAVLVVAGDLPVDAAEQVSDAFAHLPARVGSAERSAPGSCASRTTAPALETGRGRVERRQGELARLLLALPAPSATGADYPGLRLLVTLLCGGRTSRLHRELVEERKLCLWVSGDLSETVEGGTLVIALEVVPGIEPSEVEALLVERLQELTAGGAAASDEELERAHRILLADWVFSHERIHQQALGLGQACALFEPDHPRHVLETALACSADELRRLAARYLDLGRGGVVGWSLPS